MATAIRHDEGAAYPGERALFFRHWLRRPLAIGAILPSCPAVARAMAREIQLGRPGPVLELGGGTGSVTRGLIAAGCSEDRLIIVERETELARLLRRRFTAARVIEGDACAIAGLLDERGISRLAAVVSSLPIKWFPLAAQRAVIEPCLERMEDDGVFLQLTNALASPLPMERLGISGIEVARIWSQFPPVQIWRYGRVAAR